MGKTLNIQINATELYRKLNESNTRIFLSYGGGGSSKSYTQALFETVKTLSRGRKILIIRKVAVTLKDSCIPLIWEEILPSLNIRKYYSYNKSERIITCELTGSQMIFRGLDDPEKLKSIAGITDIWIEEMTELDEKDFDQINIRLRGKEGLKITGTFNPIDENHWIKRRFFDNPDPDVTIVKTTYKDNPFIDSDFIRQMEKYKKIDYNFYKIYALGEFGKLDSGAEFYKQFKPEINTGDVFYNPNLPLHLSFDENVHPYMACSIWQADGLTAWKIDEIGLKAPANTLQHTLTEIKKRYANHSEPIYIYGDATARKADVKLERGHNFFTIIRNGLSEYNTIMRVSERNPSTAMRGLFINAIFNGDIDGVRVIIGNNCTESINDFKYVKEASDGTKLKEKITDPRTGVTYEQYGHFSDADDYFLCRYFDAEYRKFQSGSFNKKRIAIKVNAPVIY